MQNKENQNTPHPNTTKQMLAQEDKINVELVKKIMTENKITLLSLRNQDYKKVKVENEKVNKSLLNIPTDNITELNELIYAGAKLACNKIGVPQMNSKQKYKIWMGFKARRTGKDIATTSEDAKEEKKNSGICLAKKTKTK